MFSRAKIIATNRKSCATEPLHAQTLTGTRFHDKGERLFSPCNDVTRISRGSRRVQRESFIFCISVRENLYFYFYFSVIYIYIFNLYFSVINSSGTTMVLLQSALDFSIPFCS